MKILYRKAELYHSLFCSYYDDIDLLEEIIRDGISDPVDLWGNHGMSDVSTEPGHKRNFRVVELACGTGRILRVLQGRLDKIITERFGACSWIGIDSSVAMLEFARRIQSESAPGDSSSPGDGSAPGTVEVPAGIFWVKGNLLRRASIVKAGGSADLLILAGNSLAHFSPLKRKKIYRILKHWMAVGSMGICEVLTKSVYSNHPGELSQVGVASNSQGQQWQVYETSWPGADKQHIRWWFSADNDSPAKARGLAPPKQLSEEEYRHREQRIPEDFIEDFSLFRFEPGQLQEELESAGFRVHTVVRDHRECCVYTASSNRLD